MGYQNGTRPSGFQDLITDVLFDLDDLDDDVDKGRTKEQLAASIAFIRETVKQVRASPRKRARSR